MQGESVPDHDTSCLEEATMESNKTIIAEKVQDYLNRSEWKAAIREMEKLFAIRQDPLIRVRIGDVTRKLNRKDDAIQEYIRAADLFAENGFVGKALAQYTLTLRLDPSNTNVRSKREMLRTNVTVVKLKREPEEYRVPEPQGNVI
jgi:tetratricopeptide (TPR) repeat protein